MNAKCDHQADKVAGKAGGRLREAILAEAALCGFCHSNKVQLVSTGFFGGGGVPNEPKHPWPFFCGGWVFLNCLGNPSPALGSPFNATIDSAARQ